MISYFSSDKEPDAKVAYCQRSRKYDEVSAMNAIEGAARFKMNVIAKKCSNCKHYHLVVKS